MKFRYRVLIINIIILSAALGITLFFMMQRNMDLALKNVTENAVEENNILQSAIEYTLLDVKTPEKKSYINALRSGSDMITLSLFSNHYDAYVIYDGSLIYSNPESGNDTVFTLANNTLIGRKNYIITHEDDAFYIYVASCSYVGGSTLNIINRSDITTTYDMLNDQMTYYSAIALITIIAGSVFTYMASRFLTNPLERLNLVSRSFANGDYSARANIKTHDEIGELSQSYNLMADSVSEHVSMLNDMIDRQNQFIADFTHEVKTPLTSIIGYADTIRSLELPRDKQISSASYIFSEGKRLEKMSSKLFDLIYLKDKGLIFEEFDSGRLFEIVSYNISPALEEKNIRLDVSYEDTILFGDIDLLSSAFTNLIDNARKASETGSVIHFTGKLKNEKYMICVADHGYGIDPVHLDHIRDAFYMVDKSRSRKEGGAGLGLSLANTIFERHHAPMLIESTPGSGTGITVIFDPYNGEVNSDV